MLSFILNRNAWMRCFKWLGTHGPWPEFHLYDTWWQEVDVQCELYMLLTPELCHTLWACIGQLNIEINGPYPGPPWTMTLEGVNGPNYTCIYDTPSPMAICSWHSVCMMDTIILCVPIVLLHRYPVCLHGYLVCLCMDTLCASA
jgi:hypothetical protein